MKKYAVPKHGDRFLWVRFGGAGDIFQAVADAYYVKKKFPGIKMYFLTESKCGCMVETQSYIDGILGGYKKPLSVFLKTLKLLRSKKFDWVACTHKGTHLSVMFYLAGIKNRLGCSNYVPFLSSADIYDWAKAQGINLLERTEKAFFATEENAALATQLLSPLEGKKKIFCVIGSSKIEKFWPTEYWIDFLKPLAAEGWGAVLNGYGEYETKIAQEIANSLPNGSVLNLAGKLDYAKIIAVASECQIAVGNDSGPLHLAVLSWVPTVVISDYILPAEFGYTTPIVNFAVAQNKKLETFYTRKRKQSLLAELSPETVREKFDELVKRCQI